MLDFVSLSPSSMKASSGSPEDPLSRLSIHLQGAGQRLLSFADGFASRCGVLGYALRGTQPIGLPCGSPWIEIPFVPDARGDMTRVHCNISTRGLSNSQFLYTFA